MRSRGVYSGVREHSDGGHRPHILTDDAIGLYAVCHAPTLISDYQASLRTCEDIRASISADIETVNTFIGSPDADQTAVENVLRATIEKSISQSRKAALESSASGLVTSICVALVAGRRAFLAHVGDGRIYLFRDKTLFLLTSDDPSASLITSLLSSGTSGEAFRTEAIHLLASQKPSEIDLLSIVLQPDDRLLLVPGGFGAALGDQESGRQVNGIENLSEWLEGTHGTSTDGPSPWESSLLVTIEQEAVLNPTDSFCGSDWGSWRNIPVFQCLSYREGLMIMALAKRRWVGPGTEIVTEGDLGDELYFVDSGSFEVVRGNQQVAVYKTGDIIGELRMFDGAPRSANVRSLETSSILAIKMGDLFALFRRNPVLKGRFQDGLLKELIGRFRSNLLLLSSVESRNQAKK